MPGSPVDYGGTKTDAEGRAGADRPNKPFSRIKDPIIMKTLATLVPLAYLVAVAAAEESAVPVDRPADGPRHSDLSVLATPLGFTCELQDIYLTRSIGVSSADSSTSQTGTAITKHKTISGTITDSMEDSLFETFGSRSERNKRNSGQVSAEGGVGLKWGIVPTGSVSIGGDASGTGSSENRESIEWGENAKAGGSATTSISSETTQSDNMENEWRKTDETRRGDYRLICSVRLRNTDTTDTLVVDLSKAKAKIGGPGLTGVLSVPCREQDTISLGGEPTVCIFEESITDERQLEDLLRLQKEGALHSLRLMASGADFPVVSEKTGKNVLAEQEETKRRRPGTRIAIEFEELQELSPWRVSRRHTVESGTRGTPVTLREALLAVEGAAYKQSDTLPETVFSFSEDGTLRQMLDQSLLQKDDPEDYRMFAVRLTKEKNGVMETEVRLPLAPTMECRIGDCSEIAFIEFSFSEFARAAVLASAYFAPLRKEIEDYLTSTDKTALSIWKQRFDDAQLEDDEDSLPRNKETISAMDVERYHRRAEVGIAAMQFKFASCLFNGWGVKKNEKEAVEWFRKASEQSLPEAQYMLGRSYYFGNGVQKDISKAVEEYRKAAEQGLREAQWKIGFFYAKGEGVEKDMEKAFEWYRKAAEQELSIAQFFLGSCYQIGSGVEKDLEKAFEWYQKAAEQELAVAQFFLGDCYETGKGVKIDLKKAEQWFLKAAEQEFAEAQFRLGICYANDEDDEINMEKAVKWFRKAAEQGLAKAQFCLGTCYADGEGIGKDMEKAVEWFRKAAEQGDEDAQNALKILGR